MDHADDRDDGSDVFIYMGGLIPQHLRGTITHVRVHKSVKIIRARAFYCRYNLVSIEMHDGVKIIEEFSFNGCTSLRSINLLGVRVIGKYAFYNCLALENVEFGDMLETIGNWAFANTSLRNTKLAKVRIIGPYAFANCQELSEVELSEDLERIGGRAFGNCPRLRRIAIPLKANMFNEVDSDCVFIHCNALSRVYLVGGIHKTVSSLLLESWRNEMNDEIDRINLQLLPITAHNNKTGVIQDWMERVPERIEHYKSEHYTLLKEFTTLLELALWKVKLDESQDERSIGSDQQAKKVKIDMKAARQEQRITSGANIVIKNVLPFLKLE